MTDFSNQTILITGGVSGLGLAMAQAFVAGGGHLVVGGKLGVDEGAAISASLDLIKEKHPTGKFLPNNR